MQDTIRELTPHGYATDPAVKAEVEALCARADIDPKDVCRIDISDERATFYCWSELPHIVDGELQEEQTCYPVYLSEVAL